MFFKIHLWKLDSLEKVNSFHDLRCVMKVYKPLSCVWLLHSTLEDFPEIVLVLKERYTKAKKLGYCLVSISNLI